LSKYGWVNELDVIIPIIKIVQKLFIVGPSGLFDLRKPQKV